MRSRIFFMSIVVLACVLMSRPLPASETAAPQSNASLKQAFTSGAKTIVFFQNPWGGPCRQQNEILQKLQRARAKDLKIVYIDATNSADQKVFYDYGVRNLPSVVVVDSRGKIGKVFAPGIQSYETLAKTLDGLK